MLRSAPFYRKAPDLLTDPASFSDSPKAISFSPDATSGSQRFFLSFDLPKRDTTPDQNHIAVSSVRVYAKDSLAQFLIQEEVQQLDRIRQTYPFTDIDRVMERLLSEVR